MINKTNEYLSSKLDLKKRKYSTRKGRKVVVVGTVTSTSKMVGHMCLSHNSHVIFVTYKKDKIKIPLVS